MSDNDTTTKSYCIVNNLSYLEPSVNDNATRAEVTAFVESLLDRIGAKDGGTWVNIEVSNIDQGSRIENYSIIQRRS